MQSCDLSITAVVQKYQVTKRDFPSMSCNLALILYWFPFDYYGKYGEIRFCDGQTYQKPLFILRSVDIPTPYGIDMAMIDDL